MKHGVSSWNNAPEIGGFGDLAVVAVTCTNQNHKNVYTYLTDQIACWKWTEGSTKGIYNDNQLYSCKSDLQMSKREIIRDL